MYFTPGSEHMAIYTTFFLSKPEELPRGFPGWRLPLQQPVRREFRNPFTGKVSIIETREPEWPDDADHEGNSGYGVAFNRRAVRRLPRGPAATVRPHLPALGRERHYGGRTRPASQGGRC